MNNPKKPKNEIMLAELFPIIEEKLSSGAEVTFKPNGVSMLPMLRPGKDSITIQRINELKKNDVILYRRENGQFVLHRIIAKKADGYVLCGDNQWALEKGITDAMILGVLTHFYRNEKEIPLNNLCYRLYLRFLWALRLYHKAVYLGGRIIRKVSKILFPQKRKKNICD